MRSSRRPPPPLHALSKSNIIGPPIDCIRRSAETIVSVIESAVEAVIPQKYPRLQELTEVTIIMVVGVTVGYYSFIVLNSAMLWALPGPEYIGFD